MKKVIKEIEHIEHVEVWEATDGFQFDSQEECHKYERSAKGLMRSKIAKMIVGDTRNTIEDAWSIMGGMDDHDIVSIKMSNCSDLETVLQFILLSDPYYCDEGNEGRWNKIATTIEEAYNKEDVIIFGINCDGEYYFINSRQNIINNLKSLGEKKDGSENNIQE